MKSYNRIFAFVISIYILLAFGIWQWDRYNKKEHDELCRVEMNHIYQGLVKGKNFTKPDLHTYDYVKEVRFLANSVNDEGEVKKFYKKHSSLESDIVPLYIKGLLLGYVRFDYQEQDSASMVLLGAQIALFLMTALTVGICAYLKYAIIKPFQTLQDMPFELAKGHLKGEVKENQGRYFGNFVWKRKRKCFFYPFPMILKPL